MECGYGKFPSSLIIIPLWMTLMPCADIPKDRACKSHVQIAVVADER